MFDETLLDPIQDKRLNLAGLGPDLAAMLCPEREVLKQPPPYRLRALRLRRLRHLQSVSTTAQLY